MRACGQTDAQTDTLIAMGLHVGCSAPLLAAAYQSGVGKVRGPEFQAETIFQLWRKLGRLDITY